MKVQFVTIGAVTILAALTAKSQTAASSPPTSPVQTTLPTPTLPSGAPQRQGLTPNQLPNPATQASSSTSATIENSAVTQSDQLLLPQLQTIVARVPGAGSWGAVHFQVANGVVTILGSVPNAAMQQQILAAVQQTPGVVSVVNRLSTTGSAQAVAAGTSQDQTLLLRVRQTVVPQIQVAGTAVPVQFRAQQGIVTITGIVPTIEQKRQIATLVQQVPGVVQVTDLVKVNPSAAAMQNLNAEAGAVNTTTTTTGTIQDNTSGASAAAAGSSAGALTPTGRSNGTVLPPGLQGRTDLPPGLERQSSLPPGLTNGSATVPQRNP